MAGRRPVFRWGMRLFQRDWRQQTLVIGLLAFAVTAALYCSVAISNSINPPAAQFGTANLSIGMRVQGRGATERDLDALRKRYGTLEVIGHRKVAIPGSTDSVDFRDQKPAGVFGAPMLQLLAGRYPSAPGEIALTRNTAADFHTRLGATIAFGGGNETVVGIVRNPAQFDEAFALGTTADVAPEGVVALARGQFRPGGGGHASRLGGAFSISVRGGDDKNLVAVIILLLSSILLMLVALVATASFAVVAHRRQRQLGMLASVGASDGQLRLVMLSNGIGVGLAASLAGTIVAGALWVATRTRLEHLFNHRLSVFDVPWWVIGGTAVLAVGASTAAAWWPARAITRVPITEALSGRPPRPAAAHRSVLAALVLLAAGCVALDAGVNTVHGDANGWWLIPGTLAVVVGILLLSPIAIRVMTRLGKRSPLPIRLALRDLNRYSARSGAALAAIALGLGIAVSTVVVATVAKQHFDEGNLPDTQLLFTTRNDFIAPEQVPVLSTDLDSFAGTLGTGAHVFELKLLQNQLPANVDLKFDGPPPPLELARKLNAHSFRGVGRVYAATPELLDHLGLHPDPGVDVLTVAEGKGLVVLTLGREYPALRIQHYDGPGYRSAPTTLLTEAGAAKLGLPQRTSGWLVEAGHPLSSDEVRAARTAAEAAGMQVESRDKQASLLATRTIATGVGVVVALALLAMTIGLIRSEAGRDLQTLAAAGATSFTRRSLTATTSASLALLGSVLGIGGAYLGLGTIYVDRPSDLANPPLPELSMLLFGLPLIAAAAGWLLSGREPVAIVRHALD